MSNLTYGNVYNRNRIVPQSEALPDRDMVKNNAGGFVFEVSDETRLDRFAILGTDSPTYYASQQKLTEQNAKAVVELIKRRGVWVVERITEISVSGRAPKNEPALFVLALAAAKGDDATKAAAFAALPKVARTGTHLFHFAEYVNGMRGWGRGLRKAVANWYQEKDVKSLAYQVVKYQSRDGWSNRDLLRLSHPKADGVKNELYKWVVKGDPSFVFDGQGVNSPLAIIQAFEQAKKATSDAEIVRLIREYNLPREAIPTQFLNSNAVWEALLEKMPMTAMIRNLATMSKNGLLVNLSDAAKHVVSELNNTDKLRKARIHPIALLSALRTYGQGHGFRSQATWKPVQAVVKALEDAFYASFQFVEPTGKNILLGLDVSGSMTSGEIAGVPGLSPRAAAACMAMVAARTETNSMVFGFTTKFVDLGITPNMTLAQAENAAYKADFGGTDCAVAFAYAEKNKIPVDGFFIYTDSETWAGRVHPVKALNSYRQKLGRNAKSVVVGLTATPFTIADPQDGGMMDVVGFDAAAPKVMADFIR